MQAPSEKDVAITKKWKEEWTRVKNKSREEKKTALENLIIELEKDRKGKCLIRFKSTDRGTCSYNPKEKIIFLDSSCSIISALHEYGHHLYGSSELKACCYSIALFKAVFPIAYSKLKWNGHMLKV